MRGANKEAVYSNEKITLILDAAKEEGIIIPVSTRARDLPEIGKKINDKLNSRLAELNFLPASISSLNEASATFMQMVAMTKESLRKILVRGDFNEFPDEEIMHGTAKLAEMLTQFSNELDQFHHNSCLCDLKINFLVTEVNYILHSQEEKAGSLSDDAARKDLVDDDARKKKEEEYSLMNLRFLDTVWCYIEQVMFGVLMKHIGRYIHLHFEVSSLSYILLGKMRCRMGQWITETMEMKETLVKDRGYRPELLSEHNSLISKCREFIYGVLDDKKRPSSIVVEGIGEIEVESLRKYSRDVLSRAFCVKMKQIEHRKMFTRIYVEGMASHLKLSIANLVDTYMDADMFDMQMLKEPEYGLGFREMLEKYTLEREDLKDRIEKLKNTKEIFDGIVNAFNL